MKSTHSQRLEQWLSPVEVEVISRSMRGWYGPPIALGSVPGNVWATGDGDFIGPCTHGSGGSMLDYFRDRTRRMLRSRTQLNTGFAGLMQVMAAGATKREYCTLYGSAAAAFSAWTVSTWYRPSLGSYPLAGTDASAAPGGRNPVGGSDGGYALINAPTGMTQHVAKFAARAIDVSNVSMGSVLLYDRLFDVAKTLGSTATESVTGTISRYTSTTSSAADYAAGNFVFPEVGSGLANTAHSWTIQYKNQAGNPATSPSIAGIAACPGRNLDFATTHQSWFIPLAAGDYGVTNLTAMQLSATLASGVINFVVAHPLVFMAMPFCDIYFRQESIPTPVNMVRIFDNACLDHILIAAAGSGNYNQFHFNITTIVG